MCDIKSVQLSFCNQTMSFTFPSFTPSPPPPLADAAQASFEETTHTTNVTKVLAQTFAASHKQRQHTFVTTQDGALSIDIYAHKTIPWLCEEERLATCIFRVRHPSPQENIIYLIGRICPNHPSIGLIKCFNVSTQTDATICTFKADTSVPVRTHQVSTLGADTTKGVEKSSAMCNIDITPKRSMSILAENATLSFRVCNSTPHTITYNLEQNRFQYCSQEPEVA